MRKWPVFQDAQLLESFKKDGFVKLKLFELEEIRKLQEAYKEVKEEHLTIGLNFITTSHSNDAAFIDLVNAKILAVVQDKIKEVLPESDIIFSNFLVKRPVEDSATEIHQDVTIVDEDKAFSYGVWIPIQDVTVSNGAMYFVEGSHLFPTHYRTNPYSVSPYRNVQELLKEMSTVVTCQAGEVLIFTHSVLHGSFSNMTDEDRVVANVALYPKGEQIYHIHLDEENGVTEKYKMSPYDFIHLNKSRRPETAELVETKSWKSIAYSEKDIFKMMGKSYWRYKLKKLMER